MRPVDLVITDYWLPGLTGVQVIAEMKRLNPAIPVILFSGAVEAPPGSELADRVITKGMPVEELLSEIGSHSKMTVFARFEAPDGYLP